MNMYRSANLLIGPMLLILVSTILNSCKPRLVIPSSSITGPSDNTSNSISRTLYFAKTIDNDWSNIGNWWNDAQLTSQATSLPTANDSVTVLDSITENRSGIPPIVVNLTIEGITWQRGIFECVDITVTGIARFNHYSRFSYASLTGNAEFNGHSQLNEGEILGNATFNNSSSMRYPSQISGEALFNHSSCLQLSDEGTSSAGTFEPDPPPVCQP